MENEIKNPLTPNVEFELGIVKVGGDAKGGSNLPGIQKALDQGHLKRPSGQPIQVRLMDQVREPRLWQKVPTPTARDYKDRDKGNYS